MSTHRTINIGLSEEQRNGVGEILNRVLADEYVLYTKTRNYHWNVLGIHFDPLHKLFQEQYEQLEQEIDDIAERARAVGVFAVGTLQEFASLTRLSEEPGQYPDARTMIANVLHDHESIIRFLRVDLVTCDEQYGDIGTNDFLTGLMERHEKTAWMLRSMLLD